MKPEFRGLGGIDIGQFGDTKAKGEIKDGVKRLESGSEGVTDKNELFVDIEDENIKELLSKLSDEKLSLFLTRLDRVGGSLSFFNMIDDSANDSVYELLNSYSELEGVEAKDALGSLIDILDAA